jgi:hypothetical protein
VDARALSLGGFFFAANLCCNILVRADEVID